MIVSRGGRISLDMDKGTSKSANIVFPTYENPMVPKEGNEGEVLGILDGVLSFFRIRKETPKPVKLRGTVLREGRNALLDIETTHGSATDNTLISLDELVCTDICYAVKEEDGKWREKIKRGDSINMLGSTIELKKQGVFEIVCTGEIKTMFDGETDVLHENRGVVEGNQSICMTAGVGKATVLIKRISF